MTVLHSIVHYVVKRWTYRSYKVKWTITLEVNFKYMCIYCNVNAGNALKHLFNMYLHIVSV